jgi:hypothetical protein
MPNRILRSSIWTSDRFIDLPDNTYRICFLRCVSEADDLGNLEGSDGALVRIWRDFGIDSVKKAQRILAQLLDEDLVRIYDFGQKRYLHLPRFRQRVRHLKKGCPMPPENVFDNNNLPDETTVVRQTLVSRPSAESNRSESNRSESRGPVDKSESSPLPTKIDEILRRNFPKP